MMHGSLVDQGKEMRSHSLTQHCLRDNLQALVGHFVSGQRERFFVLHGVRSLPQINQLIECAE